MTTSPPTADSAPDEFLAAALAEHGDPLTGEQYMEQVLLARQAAWIEQHKADAAANALTITTVWAPLLPDFVLDADVPHVRLPQSKPKRRPKPRRYRPASYWQDRVDTLDTEMQALSTPIITDRAAAGGAGLGRDEPAQCRSKWTHDLPATPSSSCVTPTHNRCCGPHRRGRPVRPRDNDHP
ncbi:hypothetical protein [Rhodococcus jostii]|uniref:Transposase n=1 Tax=Rhodococcus jostii TaxID=132919 RepID=A0ABU4CPC4_RHOJO|nr:hypothetical protein [Rhodococcus jostii]MDV6284992.1 hypothetical protein [Rhodococcus jostii]